jgi:prepilin-type N-terminal cleavage/methylation domain-containing protein
MLKGVQGKGQQLATQAIAGFTMLEMLVVVVIIGILATISTPIWIRFIANQQVIAAQNELRQAILQAQGFAIAERRAWRFSLRTVDDHLEWTIHPDAVPVTSVLTWHPLSAQIVLNNPDTTLATKDGIDYVRFGFQGEVLYRLSTVTVESKITDVPSRCVVISTLIGATRKGREHLYKNGDRYCY